MRLKPPSAAAVNIASALENEGLERVLRDLGKALILNQMDWT
jgi:hypothetical protein